MPRIGSNSDKKDHQIARIAPNGFRLPDPLPLNEILTDIKKNKWKIGKSIGLGGFGEIYLASNDTKKQPGFDANYVIKVEPHSNGPLFSEMHFYHRVGKSDQINEWMQKKKLNFLGMPKFIASGSHKYKGMKYRFMVMERFGEDLQKLLEKNNKIFPVNTVYTLGKLILDILEYVHSHGYIHADVKASNLLTGLGPRKEYEIYLIDYGLACRYEINGQHKEFKEDLRKAHDGTIQFTSRDAHIGAHSRRGDLEILGYNMLQWLCGHLPWEENLKDPEFVSRQKNMYMSNISALIKNCFGKISPPRGITEYFSYVASLKFDEQPDYKHLKDILSIGIKASGFKDDGKLVYNSSKQSCRKFLKRPAPRESHSSSPPNKLKKVIRKSPSENIEATLPQRKLRRFSSASPSLQSTNSENLNNNNYLYVVDNPTPAMLLVMQNSLERKMRQNEMNKNNDKPDVKETLKNAKPEKEIIIYSKKQLNLSKNKAPALKLKKHTLVCSLRRSLRNSTQL